MNHDTVGLGCLCQARKKKKSSQQLQTLKRLNHNGLYMYLSTSRNRLLTRFASNTTDSRRAIYS